MLRLERGVRRGLSKGNVSEFVASDLEKVEVKWKKDKRQEEESREQR